MHEVHEWTLVGDALNRTECMYKDGWKNHSLSQQSIREDLDSLQALTGWRTIRGGYLIEALSLSDALKYCWLCMTLESDHSSLKAQAS
jgi:hypothetical protein